MIQDNNRLSMNEWIAVGRSFPKIRANSMLIQDDSLPMLPKVTSTERPIKGKIEYRTRSSITSDLDIRIKGCIGKNLTSKGKQEQIESTSGSQFLKIDSEVKVLDSKPLNKDNKDDYSTYLGTSEVEKTIQQRLEEIKKIGGEVPVELRVDLFKSLLVIDQKSPESVLSKTLRDIFDLDLQFIKRTLQTKWKTKTEQAKKAIEKIDAFLQFQPLPEEMTFQEHTFYCFCFAVFMSNLDISDIENEINVQMMPFQKGMVKPEGKWTPKNELENQNYVKFICDVSDTGLAGIKDINQLTSMRVDNKTSRFCGVRLITVSCAEKVNFEGTEDYGSLTAFKHSFINAGFLKYAYQKNPKRYWECMENIGIMNEYIQMDPTIPEGGLLRAQVEGALFMWTHELTNSVFIHGWPWSFPKRPILLKGQYYTTPQMILKWSEKFIMVPSKFSKEISKDGELLHSFGIKMQGLTIKMSDQDRVKEIMRHLDFGFEYLEKNFGKLFGRQNNGGAITKNLTSFKSV